MQLIYRGHAYSYESTNLILIKPRALNWRYQVPGQTCEVETPCRPARAPLAINWRYQYPITW